MDRVRVKCVSINRLQLNMYLKIYNLKQAMDPWKFLRAHGLFLSVFSLLVLL